MALNMNSAEVDLDVILGLLEDTLGPIEVLQTNTDLLILPQDIHCGKVLNAYAVDICTKLVSNGIVAKMVIRKDFEIQKKEEKRLELPPIMILNPLKEKVIMAVLGEWMLKRASQDTEVGFSFVVGDEKSGRFLQNSLRGTLDEMGGQHNMTPGTGGE